MSEPLLEETVFCLLCDPPHEVSVGLVGYHMTQVHGMDPGSLEFAEAVVVDDPRERPLI